MTVQRAAGVRPRPGIRFGGGVAPSSAISNAYAVGVQLGGTESNQYGYAGPADGNFGSISPTANLNGRALSRVGSEIGTDDFGVLISIGNLQRNFFSTVVVNSPGGQRVFNTDDPGVFFVTDSSLTIWRWGSGGSPVWGAGAVGNSYPMVIT